MFLISPTCCLLREINSYGCESPESAILASSEETTPLRAMKQESFRAAVNAYEKTMEEDQKEGKYAWRGAKWMAHL